MEPIRVAIVEDLKEVALSVSELLNAEPDMTCQHIYHHAEDAMHFLPHAAPDVVVIDIGLPRASGIEAIRALRAQGHPMQFCMFTVYEDDDKIFDSLRAGAKGYILKTAPPETIVHSIRELHQGGSPMSPSIARRVLDVFMSGSAPAPAQPLPITDREQEILTLLAKGMLYKEIADSLQISTGTVKQHIHKIYGKLQVSNKTEAINKLKLS